MKISRITYTPTFQAYKYKKNEWIDVSGNGSYASASIDGTNTRMYHALISYSKVPPVERNVMLQRIEDEVFVDGRAQKLSNTAYLGLKNGHDESEMAEIDDFKVLPVPTWKYDLGNDKTLEKKAVMPKNRREGVTFVVGYTYNAPEGSEPLKLSLKPLFNNRPLHKVAEKYPWNHQIAPMGAQVWETFRNSKLYLTWNKEPEIISRNNFYNDLYFKREEERGLRYAESNLYQPFDINVELKPGETFTFSASTLPNTQIPDIEKEVEKKDTYYKEIFEQSELDDSETSKLLQRAADQFIVSRKSTSGRTILAGYHWFNDWGRDTMIAIPGLTLTTKRFKDAEAIMSTFTFFTLNGMLPNNFPEIDGNSPGYNTIDASMWWFNTLNEYIKAAGSKADPDFVKDQYLTLKNVVKHHLYGLYSGKELSEVFGDTVDANQCRLPVGESEGIIGMDLDGLLTTQDGQLTWMDAAVWDGRKRHVATPRDGKAIEINALWYNGLRVMEELARHHNDHEGAKLYSELASRVQESMKKFVDCINGGLKDLIDVPKNERYYRERGRLSRPNQLIAISLDHCAFSKYVQKDVLKLAEEKLLTPYGLRTLAPGQHGYSPYYPNSDPDTRDMVYHQGPVWTWPMGAFCDAYLKVHGDTPETREKVRGFIEPVLKHLRGEVEEHAESGACVGGIAEIFDAQEPYYSKGAVNQAWSVAEILRIYAKVNK